MASKWDELERWMEGQRLPQGFEVLREPDWVERYIRKLMTKALPEAAGAMNASKAAFTESEQYLIVKIKLPEHAVKEELRLFVREDRLRIEGLQRGAKEEIKLPKLVKPRICKAIIRDEILHVKLRKRPMSRTYYESAIRW